MTQDHAGLPDDYGFGGWTVQHWRETALRIAVKTFDQDAAINVLELMGVAQTLIAYIRNGEIPLLFSFPKTGEPHMSNQSLEATERQAAEGATAPRVSIGTMQDEIANVYYVNAGQAVRSNWDTKADTKALDLMTLCFLEMKNGFVLVGKSAPASAANYDQVKGRDFAYEDALRQLWPLMGFALRERLSKEEKT